MRPIPPDLRFIALIASLITAVQLVGPVNGEPPNSAARPAVLRAAARIDDLVAADLAKHDLTPNQPACDEVFVRRTYLAITGMTPSYHQAKDFLESKAPYRRANLIDDLLKSEGYVNHFSNLWADTLRIHSKMGLGEYYRDLSNQPFAQTCHTMNL